MIFAYIDPSSMTYLIQVLAGVVIAAGAGIGFYWKRIRRSIRKKKREKEEALLAKQAEEALKAKAAAGESEKAPQTEADPVPETAEKAADSTEDQR
jgi:phosphotransferase system  glucose/maltose/N-acetylglucosamine-specific IIC component